LSSGLNEEIGGLDIVDKEDISPGSYESFQYISLETLKTLESNSIAQSGTQLSIFSQSPVLLPQQAALKLPTMGANSHSSRSKSTREKSAG
jgi:hypothetical protein